MLNPLLFYTFVIVDGEPYAASGLHSPPPSIARFT